MSIRYFITEPADSRPRPDYHVELLASLERINTYNPPVQTCSTGWKFSGLYSGPTSIAYLFYRLSQIYPDLLFKNQTLIDWAEAYLSLSAHVRNPNPTPSNCGIANEALAQTALSSAILDDSSLALQLCKFEPTINHPDDSGSNEWLYGRAGYLYFLRLCHTHFTSSNTKTADLLTQTIQRTITRILQVPLPWTWHGKAYLGAAHGTIGIITQIILSSPQSIPPQCTDILLEVLKTQLPSGNFPPKLPSDLDNTNTNTNTNTNLPSPSHNDNLVQFCHGAAGPSTSLRAILPLYPPTHPILPALQTILSKTQPPILSRGLLTKPPSLCHGIAGNALALIDDNDFERFLGYMTSDMLEANEAWMSGAGRSDEFVGLFCGEAGRAWVWAVAERGLERRVLGYDDL